MKLSPVQFRVSILKYNPTNITSLLLSLYITSSLISTSIRLPDSTTTIWGEGDESDQCKDVIIQESPEFSFCLKAISQKWPTELAVLPCCWQFKKMDEKCRCEAFKHIINAEVAAAAAPSDGEGDGLVPDTDAESRDQQNDWKLSNVASLV